MTDIEQAEALAAKLGTFIPCGIPKHLWSLPLLAALTLRLEQLEARVAGPSAVEGSEGFCGPLRGPQP